MAVSKKRKRAGRVVRHEPLKAVPKPASQRLAVKLNGAHFVYLKNEPDFRTMVKVGRVMNAMSFAAQTVVDYCGDPSFRGQRQYHRGLFVLAGYLHQGIKVVQGIKGRYLLFGAFEPLRRIALDAEYEKARAYARKIRNCTAFHLDEFDEDDRTGAMLSTLKPTTYTLMGWDEDTIMSAYFEFADFLDLGFIVEEFAPGSESQTVIDEIFETILKVSIEFLTAANDFQIALARKMELKEYVYK